MNHSVLCQTISDIRVQIAKSSIGKHMVLTSSGCLNLIMFALDAAPCKSTNQSTLSICWTAVYWVNISAQKGSNLTHVTVLFWFLGTVWAKQHSSKLSTSSSESLPFRCRLVFSWGDHSSQSTMWPTLSLSDHKTYTEMTVVHSLCYWLFTHIPQQCAIWKTLIDTMCLIINNSFSHVFSSAVCTT